MSTPALLLAWILSLAPVVAPALGFDLELEHPAGLVLLVWLALAGLPRASATTDPEEDAVEGATYGDPRPRGARPLAAAALALPPLTAAALLDRGPIAASAGSVLLGVLLVWLLAAGATRAAGRARHGLAWLLLVPGLPLLSVCLGWASSTGRGTPPIAVAWLAAQSPLSWAHAWLVDWPFPRGAVGPLAVALLLLLIARPPAEAEEAA